ncbi:YdcF family protein [Oceanospirillum sanctuarii]|uniref:YdcF family protein n=1 Tax=Oceanospirillum sanctuarii TaxID=1434821 RepID=UPI000A3A5B87|nr:YdcF family protein [Oceanospirillum sanctuarii]
MLLRATKYLLLPPAINILLILIAWFLMKRWPKLRLATLLSSILSLWLLSTPLVAISLADLLQNRYPALSINESLNQSQQLGFDAVVILGAGRDYRAEEWQGLTGSAISEIKSHTVSSYGLQRLHYGAVLSRVSGKPMLLTGGRVYGEPLSEAELMQQTLQRWGQEAQWLETESRTTAENALFSAKMLKDENIKRIALVTHGWHMSRSVAIFEKAGFEVVPAPTAFYAMPESLWLQLLPKSSNLEVSSRMLHEVLGQIWYSLRYR